MDQRLFFLLNMARHKVFQHVDAEAEKQLGVPVTQVAALLFLAKNEGCQQKELGTALGLNKPAVSGLVGRMQKHGLIERRQSESDGRAWCLFITNKGREVLPLVPSLLGQLNSRLTDGFDEAELEVVQRFLNAAISRF